MYYFLVTPSSAQESKENSEVDMNTLSWKFQDAPTTHLQSSRVHSPPPSKELTRSLRKFGICAPIIGVHEKNEPEKIHIIQGHQRFQSAVSCDHPTVPVFVNQDLQHGKEADMAEIKELQIMIQKQRDVSPIVLGQWCRELISFGGHTVGEAAKRVNMSRTAMQDLLCVDQLYNHLLEMYKKKKITRETLTQVACLNKRKLVILGRNLETLNEALLKAALVGTTREFDTVLEFRKHRKVRIKNSMGRMVSGVAKVTKQEKDRLKEANEFEVHQLGQNLGDTLCQGIQDLNIPKEMTSKLLGTIAAVLQKRLSDKRDDGDDAGQGLGQGQPVAHSTSPGNGTEKTTERRAEESREEIREESKEVSNIYNNSLLTDNYRDGDGAPDKRDRDAFLKRPSRKLSELERSVCDEINRRLSIFGNNMTPQSLGRFLNSGITLDGIVEEFNYLIHRPGSSPGAVLYNQLLKKVMGRWRRPSCGFVNRKYFKKGAPGDPGRLVLKPLDLREMKEKKALIECQNEGVADWPKLKKRMKAALPERDRRLLDDVKPIKEDVDSIFLAGNRPIVGDLLLEDYGHVLEKIAGKSLIFK